MSAGKAAQQLAWTLKGCPGVLGVYAEGPHGGETIVLRVTGRTDTGPGEWCGYPVRLTNERS